jgi:hypothetical protein
MKFGFGKHVDEPFDREGEAAFSKTNLMNLSERGRGTSPNERVGVAKSLTIASHGKHCERER